MVVKRMGFFDKFDAREIRQRLGLNQDEFWTKIGVTQSGGSRYESGRDMPKPVRELLRLVHVEQIDLEKVKREDFEILEFLKAEQPELYKKLRRAAARAKGSEPHEHAAES
jgi:transcriptional regulator with XRE-family HTH domain